MTIVAIQAVRAEMHANRLLGSPMPGHVKSSDRSAVKKTDNGYQGKECPC